jgi:ERCC4-type nuclease
MPELIIDYRERNIVVELEKIFPKLRVARLPVGDLIITKTTNSRWDRVHDLEPQKYAIVIERKSLADFMGSIRSGRIWDQMDRMRNTEDVKGIRLHQRILAIHGTFEDYFAQIPNYQINDEIKDDGFWRFITNSMSDIILKYGIPIIMLNDKMQFLEFIKYLVHTNLNFINTEIIMRKYRQKKRIKLAGNNLQVDMLCSIPLIRYRLAERLLDEFKTISTICEASQKDLRKVRGIGKKKADIIYRVLHDDSKIQSTKH